MEGKKRKGKERMVKPMLETTEHQVSESKKKSSISQSIRFPRKRNLLKYSSDCSYIFEFNIHFKFKLQ